MRTLDVGRCEGWRVGVYRNLGLTDWGLTYGLRLQGFIRMSVELRISVV